MTEDYVNGKIIEAPKPNEVYLALFNSGDGWLVSGVIYHQPEEAVRNLAAFNPKRVLIVKVEIPEE